MPSEISSETHAKPIGWKGAANPHLCECEFCGDESPLLLTTHPIVAGRTGAQEDYLVCRECLPRLSTGTLDKGRVRRSADGGGHKERELLVPSAVFLL